MQLRRLRVRNIRSYESGEVDFTTGTTLLSGDVGAGKTSLLYAIEMALFGVAEVDAAYLVRHGAGHAEVEVELEDPDHRYRISRRFRRVRRKGKETFEPEKISFRVDGAETTYSATELRQRVIELLGFPDNPNPQAHSDLWRWAVYVPQERMRDILGAKPQDRLETVRKALGVERYRVAAENAELLGSDLRRTARQRRAEADRLRHFESEFAEATADSDRWLVERQSLSRTIAERTAEVDRTSRELAAAEGSLRQSEADRRELEGLEREEASEARRRAQAASDREERVRELDRQSREAEETGTLARSLEDRRNALVEAERRREALRAETDRLGGSLRALAEARAELAAVTRHRAETETTLARAVTDRTESAEQLEALEKEGPTREPPAPTARSLSEIDLALGEARRAEASRVAELSRGQSALGELDELLAAGRCPRCHQEVRATEFEGHREEARASVRALEETLAAAAHAREALETERRSRERWERAHDRWSEVEKRRALARSRIDRIEEELRRATTARDEVEAQRRAVERRVLELATTEPEERRRRAELAAAESEARAHSERVTETLRAVEREKAARAAHAALSTEVARLDRDLAELVERATARTARRATLGETLRGSEERVRARAIAETALAEVRRQLENDTVVAARLDARLEDSARRTRSAERGRRERATLLAEADDLEQKAEWVAGPFRKALLAMEQKLLAHAQVAFERNFARYFASLIDDPALVARTDVAFTPAVTIEGEWTPADALSGGERTSLALAFRLALSQVVRQLGSLRLETILLDEPTDGFSPEQVVRMGELLDELALPQVVIVSHEGELAGIADRVVRVEKRDGRSVLTGRNGSPPAVGNGTPDDDPPPSGSAPGPRSAT